MAQRNTLLAGQLLLGAKDTILRNLRREASQVVREKVAENLRPPRRPQSNSRSLSRSSSRLQRRREEEIGPKHRSSRIRRVSQNRPTNSYEPRFWPHRSATNHSTRSKGGNRLCHQAIQIGWTSSKI